MTNFLKRCLILKTGAIKLKHQQIAENVILLRGRVVASHAEAELKTESITVCFKKEIVMRTNVSGGVIGPNLPNVNRMKLATLFKLGTDSV